MRRTRGPSRGNTCATSCLHTRPPLPERSYTPEEEVYLRTHAQRYELLLDLVARLAPRRILVVAPSFESSLLRKELPTAQVDTLGWEDDRFPRREGEHHTQLDLNTSDSPELDPHDVIVCGELIEHLHVALVPVLRFLAGGLSAGGSIVIQTPNATALPKRLRMLIGRNPYEPIRSTPKNPGHFHEYTVGELRLALDEAGFEITRLVTANYFAHGSRQNRAFRALGRMVPRTLRGGITVVARPRP